ncbi:hypothetical protein [Pseudophaeobacter sp.]|uniref:hypothetical protein n=2 Tax=Pseudophaeobacter sp. TaxID=1971739 RepID=UPI00405A1E2B
MLIPRLTGPMFNFLGVLRGAMSRVILLASLAAAFAQPVSSDIALVSVPANAHQKSYGEGWECDASYRLVDDACIAVIVPQNAYATNRTYGSGWECTHGFVEVGGESCAEIVVPDGGFLDPSGKRWGCLRGFRKIDDSCQKIVLPDNAYLTENVHGAVWQCVRGYQTNGTSCVEIAVPKNAFLNTSTYGRRWTCERGYAVSGDLCSRLDLPENAHLDRTGNSWVCNRNFQRKKDRCILAY